MWLSLFRRESCIVRLSSFYETTCDIIFGISSHHDGQYHIQIMVVGWVSVHQREFGNFWSIPEPFLVRTGASHRQKQFIEFNSKVYEEVTVLVCHKVAPWYWPKQINDHNINLQNPFQDGVDIGQVEKFSQIRNIDINVIRPRCHGE